MHTNRIGVAWIAAIALLCGMHPTDLRAMQIPSAMGVNGSYHRYSVPPITLSDQHGQQVRLDRVLTGTQPVLVQFFFTTCTTICGVRSAQLVAIAPKLAKAGVDVGLYTISIDPERDTSEQLLAYARQFGTPPPNWHLLTGTADAVRQMQSAFDASDPSADRMMHKPLTFIRGGKNRSWLRIDGMTSAHQLLQLIESTVSAGR